MKDKAAEDYQQAVKLTTDEARRSELLEKLSLIKPQTSAGSSLPTQPTPELSGPVSSMPTEEKQNPVRTKTAGPGWSH